LDAEPVSTLAQHTRTPIADKASIHGLDILFKCSGAVGVVGMLIQIMGDAVSTENRRESSKKNSSSVGGA